MQAESEDLSSHHPEVSRTDRCSNPLRCRIGVPLRTLRPCADPAAGDPEIITSALRQLARVPSWLAQASRDGPNSGLSRVRAGRGRGRHRAEPGSLTARASERVTVGRVPGAGTQCLRSQPAGVGKRVKRAQTRSVLILETLLCTVCRSTNAARSEQACVDQGSRGSTTHPQLPSSGSGLDFSVGRAREWR